VADDNPAFLKKLVLLLTANFDVVATAADGNAALALIRRYVPDLAVLDLDMPGLNGMEVTLELAKSSKGPPVLICSIILGRLDIRNSFQTCRLSEVIGPVQYCGDTVEKAAPVTV
jgi:CheY-like chemotaxis protein